MALLNGACVSSGEKGVSSVSSQILTSLCYLGNAVGQVTWLSVNRQSHSPQPHIYVAVCLIHHHTGQLPLLAGSCAFFTG
uniref:Uncharacterized protein n=1 Tax=Aegilops tauschii subsp. strangulata TaxID=200361 RepID=A0A453NEU8_AEGTS